MAALNSKFGETGARSIADGLRVQTEMLSLFSEIGEERFARATSEAELAFKLPNKLMAARSVPDAISAYQEWLGEWMTHARRRQPPFYLRQSADRRWRRALLRRHDASRDGLIVTG